MVIEMRKDDGLPTQDVEQNQQALFREQQAFETKLLGGMKFSRVVGAFEGANYEARGLYRPEADCIMFSRNVPSNT